MIRAAAVAALLSLALGACGVKAPPRPPVEPKQAPAASPAATDPGEGQP